MKKTLALVIAMVMVMSSVCMVFAAENSPNTDAVNPSRPSGGSSSDDIVSAPAADAETVVSQLPSSDATYKEVVAAGSAEALVEQSGAAEAVADAIGDKVDVADLTVAGMAQVKPSKADKADSNTEAVEVAVPVTGVQVYEAVTAMVKTENGWVVAPAYVKEPGVVVVEMENMNDKNDVVVLSANPIVDTQQTEHSTEKLDMMEDVAKEDWFYDAADFAVTNGIFQGKTETKLAPNADLTRQELWLVLARFCNSNANTFAEAKAWAVSRGISDGTNGSAAISREQVITMLYRLYGSKTGAAQANFADMNSVSSWAVDAVNWAAGNGILEGYEDNTMKASKSLSRAEMATLLMRLTQK